ncbi:MAG: outer rane efflux protein [Bacteroidetes bacterium]|nr:outer rane efflux protein [Bacteroidota bacterium]
MKKFIFNKNLLGTLLFLVFSTPIFLNAQNVVHVDLNKAIEIGLSESPSIQIAERNILIKKYYKSEQIVGLFPSVSIAASYNRTLKKQKMVMEFMGTPMEIEIGSSNSYNAGASFALPLVMPVLWNNLKLTQLDVEMTMEKARSSKIELVNQIKKAYFSLLMMQESYNVLLASYKNTEDNNKIIADKFSQGLVSEFEKLRADVQLENQKPNLLATQNAIELNKKLLKMLMGIDINENIIFDGELSQFESQMDAKAVPVKEALSILNNTDLKQIDLSIQQLNRTKSLVLSSSLPTLAMSGVYQYASLSNDYDFANYNWFPYSMVGFSLQIPITSWASTHYKIKQTNLTIQNLQDTKKTLEKSVWINVFTAVDNIDKAIENHTSSKETLKMAQRAYDIAKRQYEIGMSTWLDLNNADLALTRAKLQFLQSIHDYLSAYSDLEKYLGNN